MGMHSGHHWALLVVSHMEQLVVIHIKKIDFGLSPIAVQISMLPWRGPVPSAPSQGKRVSGFQDFSDPMNMEQELIQKRIIADASALQK